MKSQKTFKNVFIADDAIITGHVHLGKDTSIWYKSVLRAETDAIIIDESSNIQDGCILHTDENYPIHIGKNVTIGHGAIIHGCEIGDETVVGMGAIILNGAKIGKHCMIGAGALVTQNTVIPDGMMVLGSPAKIKRPLTENEIEGNKKSALHYIEMAKEHFLYPKMIKLKQTIHMIRIVQCICAGLLLIINLASAIKYLKKEQRMC